MVRIGIIGLGFMGRMHYEAWSRLPGAEVSAVCDADPRRAAGDLSGGWGNVAGAEVQRLPMDRMTGTTDPDVLLAIAGLDIVDICLPTPAHVEMATRALASGKHVICEKPLARSVADARTIADAARSATGFFMPAMCLRFWPHWEWLARATRERTWGALRALSIRRRGAMPAGWFANGALSGGGILDLHVHDADFVYSLLGKPAAVFSRGLVGVSGEIDHVVTQYLYAAGPEVSAEGSWMMSEGWPFAMTYTAVFERATADYDSSRSPALLLYSAGAAQPIEVSAEDGYQRELAYFLDCVKTKTRPTRVTADDAVAGLEIIAAERESIRTRRVIDVNDPA